MWRPFLLVLKPLLFVSVRGYSGVLVAPPKRIGGTSGGTIAEWEV